MNCCSDSTQRKEGLENYFKDWIYKKGRNSCQIPFLTEDALGSEIPLTLKTEDTVGSIVHLW
jgi:hypothetical protein